MAVLLPKKATDGANNGEKITSFPYVLDKISEMVRTSHLGFSTDFSTSAISPPSGFP